MLKNTLFDIVSTTKTNATMTTLIQNKKAHFNYEITDKLTAGIELLGFEVKSIRAGTGSLEGTYVTIRGAEAFIIGMHITPFQTFNTPKDYDPIRNRKLLLTKKEITELEAIEKKKGLTIVPISVYSMGRKIKVELGIARGKKSFDKRESIKKRDSDRDIRRAIKDR
jgi:SsrA-binding protein